jgi:hypothetical protein
MGDLKKNPSGWADRLKSLSTDEEDANGWKIEKGSWWLERIG